MSSTRPRRAAARSFWVALACPLVGVVLVLLYPADEWAFDILLVLCFLAAAAVALGSWLALRPAGLIVSALGAGTVGCLALVLAPVVALLAYWASGGDATILP